MNRCRYLLFLLIYLALGLVACSNSDDSIPCKSDPRCIIYGITSDIIILDPHISDSTVAGIVLRQVYDTLIYRDAVSNNFVPGLASDWEISEDGFVYTFFLRRDVIFHDGSPFNAQAVATNIDRIFEPEINSQGSKLLLGSFSRYEIVDEFTIRFYLTEPYVPFLDGLAQPFLGIISPSALESYSNLRYQFHQVGTGPFKLDNYLPGERIELSRNTDYRWAPSVYNPLVGDEINKIEFKMFLDPVLRADAIINADADVIGELLPTDARTFANNSAIQLVPIEIPGQSVQFYFNTQRRHIVEQSVREALLLATNRIAISDAVFLNFSPVSWSPLSTSTDYAHTGYINQFQYDALRATDILNDLGYQDTDGDNFLDLEGERLSLTMIVPPWGQLPQVASLIRQQWRDIGVDLIIEPVPGFNTLLTRLSSGEYDLVTFDNFGVDPSLLNTTFLSTATNNVTGYVSETLDEMLIQGIQEKDSRARRSLYFQVQDIIMQQSLILPIREYVNINAIRATIDGLRYDAYGWYPILYNVRVNPQQ